MFLQFREDIKTQTEAKGALLTNEKKFFEGNVSRYRLFFRYLQKETVFYISLLVAQLILNVLYHLTLFKRFQSKIWQLLGNLLR